MQSYKIYINEVKVILTSTTFFSESDWSKTTDKKVLTAKYIGMVKHLMPYIDMCEKKSPYHTVVLYDDNFKQLKKDFKGLFTIVEAAGGIVHNDQNEILMIFRRGSWDMPKGKIEDGETLMNAAKREVAEETGIKDIKVLEKLGKTNHVFRNKDGRNIKKSHWYIMKAPTQKLVPQAEEDIEKAIWCKYEDIAQRCQPMYHNITDILELYKEKYLDKIDTL